MKKILILGAGIYQVPLIKKARELGIYTIVTSIPGKYPGFAYADKVYYNNTTDSDSVIKIAETENIDGICTAGTDVAVRTIGAVCDRLGLAGVSYDAACRVTDKYSMKCAFAEGGVTTSDFFKIRSVKELKDIISADRRHFILKAVDRSGSRGIIRIDRALDADMVYEACRNETFKDYLLLEEFVEGTEIGVDAYIQGGKLMMLAPHDKITYHSKGTTIPIGHIFPYRNDKKILNKIAQETEKVIRCTGISDCALNMDVMITNNGRINIIEAGARAGATGIPELISEFCGVNYYEYIIRGALGMKLQAMKETGINCASILLLSDRGGILKKLEFDSTIPVSVVTDYEYGQHIHEFTDGTCRIGQAIIKDRNYDRLMTKLEAFRESVKVEVCDEQQTE